MRKIVSLLFMGMLLASLTLAACNNKKKDSKTTTTDTTKGHPTAPGD